MMSEQQSVQQLTISQMTLEQKKELVDKYNHSDYIKVGTFLDAQDSTFSYLFAQAVQLDQNGMVEVCFDGWSKRWNLWYKIKSVKVAPFRSQAEGYSGQKKVAIRSDMIFRFQDLAEVSLFIFLTFLAPLKSYSTSQQQFGGFVSL